MSDSMPPPDNQISPLADRNAPGVLPPGPDEPPADWEHSGLFQNVRNALYALPTFFRSDLCISGVLATDLFTFNASLGAIIEVQVVEALNTSRMLWDPAEEYKAYSFVRQPQRFPDVILRTSTPDQHILMGIERKGWYVLAREREPSFRYRVTPAVCAPADLLVVYPWALSNVISGSPRLFQPYVVSARYAAAYRNWHWQHAKGGGGSEIDRSAVAHFYPIKRDKSADQARQDKGNNFGRFARTGLMDAYMHALFQEDLAGIPLDAWQKFLSHFAEADKL